MNEQSIPTVADMIRNYIKIRDAIKQQQADLDKAQEPLKDAMKRYLSAITKHLLALDHDEGKRNISIPGIGVAFRKSWFSAKVADPEAFFNFVIDNNERQFLTTHVALNAVREYMDENHGLLPPGVDTAHGWETRIQRKDDQ